MPTPGIVKLCESLGRAERGFTTLNYKKTVHDHEFLPEGNPVRRKSVPRLAAEPTWNFELHYFLVQKAAQPPPGASFSGSLSVRDTVRLSIL